MIWVISYLVMKYIRISYALKYIRNVSPLKKCTHVCSAHTLQMNHSLVGVWFVIPKPHPSHRGSSLFLGTNSSILFTWACYVLMCCRELCLVTLSFMLLSVKGPLLVAHEKWSFWNNCNIDFIEIFLTSYDNTCCTVSIHAKWHIG